MISISGKVIRSTGSWYTVFTRDEEAIECRLKGNFRLKGIRDTNPVAVGDNVKVERDENAGNAVITEIGERTNYLIRKATKLSKATHIIAANVDQVVIIVSIIKPRTSTGFIDRILTTAEAYHIPSTIVFNKWDLYKKEHVDWLELLKKAYKNAGYGVLITSVPLEKNLQAFKDLLMGKISLLAGHSGVGKSAMINSVDPTLELKTGKISTVHEKGKHTTTYAEMLRLSFGGYIIDTPGIKEFGLVEFEKAELGQRFPEFRKLMKECRFNNCLHIDEPGCAVVNELEKGNIAYFRYENYLNMLSSL